MRKLSKRDLILRSIIEAYLNQNLPIGSAELGTRMSGAIPASTIRVYFKKLSDEGEITQLHISGGRIPTHSAMKRYWIDEFSRFLPDIFIDDERVLSALCDKFGVYCMVFSSSKQNLKDVLNLNDKFIVLEFDNDELVIKFDLRIQKFLANLKGVSLDQLEEFSAQVGLSELRAKIRELKRTKIYFQTNEMVAFEIFGDARFKALLEPSVANILSEPLTFSPIFESGYMGLKLPVDFQDKSATLVCAGSVYVDYINFLNQIKEAA